MSWKGIGRKRNVMSPLVENAMVVQFTALLRHEVYCAERGFCALWQTLHPLC